MFGILLVGASIYYALRVVNVTIFPSPSYCLGIGRVGQVEKDKARTKRGVPRLESSGDAIVLLLICDNVVGSAKGKALVPKAIEISFVTEYHGLLRIDVCQLVHIEYLHAVLHRFAANDDVALVTLDLPPKGRRSGSVLRQAAEINELPFVGDFRKSGAIRLSDSDKLPSLGACPAPRAGSLAGRASQLGMVFEVVEVEVAAAESVLGVPLDVRCDAVRAWHVVRLFVKGSVLGRIIGTRRSQLPPNLLY